MLDVEGVRAGYGRTRVLHDVSLRVGDGEIVALLGPNGAGKTTLLKCLMGLVKPTSGSIHFEGRSIVGRYPDDLSRHGIALVPEGRRIFAVLSVHENLLLSARGTKAEATRNLEFVLDSFPILKEKLKDRGSALSGGQQQMLALARAIMQQPRLVLMDEPSIGLSPMIVSQLPGMIREVQERTGASVLLVEQQLGLAVELASRGYVLSAGRIVQEAPGAELGTSPLLLEAYLGKAAVASTDGA